MEHNMKQEPRPLAPNHIYRPCEAIHFFGYKSTQLDEKIKAGEIPAPIKLSDTGRAVGWLGSQIIEWQAKRVAAGKRECGA
jgi:predicted DNA-binding transcriptional regulator AlpA